MIPVQFSASLDAFTPRPLHLSLATQDTLLTVYGSLRPQTLYPLRYPLQRLHTPAFRPCGHLQTYACGKH